MKNFEELEADLETHPITGYLRGSDEYMSIPLISHIEGGLYVGGCVDGVELGDYFDVVVSLYKWEAYSVAPTTQVHTYTMYDSTAEPDADEVQDIANVVIAALRAGKKVLVHCQAGINRSNLVAATALVGLGYTPSEAVALLRSRRSPRVLANKAFERFLLG